jgi:ribosomal protein S18 acetylase RimI-like enzyme
MINIRKATLEDLPTIQRLAHEIWPHTYATIVSPDQLSYMLNLIYSIPSLQNQVQQQHHQFIIAELEGQPVAFAGYSIVEPGVCKLHKIYVHQHTQGKGLGKLLIDHVIGEMQAQGVHTIRLNVNRQNKARYFYEKLGFAVKYEEDIDIGNNYFMVDYVMEKAL